MSAKDRVSGAKIAQTTQTGAMELVGTGSKIKEGGLKITFLVPVAPVPVQAEWTQVSMTSGPTDGTDGTNHYWGDVFFHIPSVIL